MLGYRASQIKGNKRLVVAVLLKFGNFILKATHCLIAHVRHKNSESPKNDRD